MQYLPYGMWKSKIEPDLVANRGRLSNLKWRPRTDELIFSGSRSGKSFLISANMHGGQRTLNRDLSVGGCVGYGGGDFDCGTETILFSSPKRGLIRISDSDFSCLTHDQFGTASPAISPDGKFAAYVTSDEVHDQIALINLTEYSWPIRWIHGADFYMQPVWSPDGRYFAWAEWNHPHMPWNGSIIQLAEIDVETKAILNVRKVAGGEEFPASQPLFSPDSRKLSFIRTNIEWEDLVLYHIDSCVEETIISGDGFSLAEPAFVQGLRSYDWFPQGNLIAFTKIEGASSSLWTVSLDDRKTLKISDDRFTGYDQVCVSKISGKIAAIADSPFEPSVIVTLEKGKAERVFSISDIQIPANCLSAPQEISWKSKDNRDIHGIFYPPCNPDFSWVGLPPAIVHIHGGPTSKVDLQFNPEIAFFNSLGYAWLEVNYRGSHGYGRSYLDCLNGHWGEYDVEDAISGADMLGARNLADRGRMLITGGSAGGYTVYNALIQKPDSFAAGAALYGVSNLFGLLADTDKFELHYPYSLVGPLPESSQKFFDWSPLFHAHKIKAPIAIFQGDQDNVVPPVQSEEMARKIQGKVLFRLYSGEGHGFRKPETIADYLKAMTDFLRDHV